MLRSFGWLLLTCSFLLILWVFSDSFGVKSYSLIKCKWLKSYIVPLLLKFWSSFQLWITFKYSGVFIFLLVLSDSSDESVKYSDSESVYFFFHGMSSLPNILLSISCICSLTDFLFSTIYFLIGMPSGRPCLMCFFWFQGSLRGPDGIPWAWSLR